LKIWVIFISILLSGCATMQQNCGVFERGSSEYRLCHAKKGSKIHQFRYAMELFVKNDIENARDWLFRAAKDDVSYTNRNIDPMGLISDNNPTVRDKEVGEKGDKAAAFMLAKIYDEGLGIKVDRDKADYYRTKAGNTVVEIEELSDRYTIKLKTKMVIMSNGENKEGLYDLYSFKISKK